VLNNRGITLLRLGQFEPAAASFSQALMATPNEPVVLCNLGNAKKGLNRLSEAMEHYRAAIRALPTHVDAHFNLGLVHQIRNELAEAAACYERAVALATDHIDALNNLGVTMRDMGKHTEALRHTDAALARQPNFAQAHNNRGLILRQTNRLTEALESFDRAILLAPDNTDFHINRGHVLKDLQRLPEALNSYDHALSLHANHPDALWNKSLALILGGNYELGWPLYDARLLIPALRGNIPVFTQALWNGQSPLLGKTILVHGEQGYGDSIQFCRYLPLLANAGATVLFRVQRALIPLMQSLDPRIQLLDMASSTLPAFDFYCPLMSLPARLKTTLTSIPGQRPYLHAGRERLAIWSAKLNRPAGVPNLGLAWCGAERHQNDTNRSMALETLAPAIDKRANWHGLVKEPRAADSMTLGNIKNLYDHADDLQDFADTAALIEHLDLIITVDTSVAHLAGALGKRVWVLLPYAPDYRWLLDRYDSPWYPSMRLFRQTQPGQWDAVVDEIQAALDREFFGGP
jgi:tetratricopeptide (TPR) repeat protein